MKKKSLSIGSLYTYSMGCGCGRAFKVTSDKGHSWLGATLQGIECENQRLVNCFGEERNPVIDVDVPKKWIGTYVMPISTVEEARKYKP